MLSSNQKPNDTIQLSNNCDGNKRQVHAVVRGHRMIGKLADSAKEPKTIFFFFSAIHGTGKYVIFRPIINLIFLLSRFSPYLPLNSTSLSTYHFPCYSPLTFALPLSLPASTSYFHFLLPLPASSSCLHCQPPFQTCISSFQILTWAHFHVLPPPLSSSIFWKTWPNLLRTTSNFLFLLPVTSPILLQTSTFIPTFLAESPLLIPTTNLLTLLTSDQTSTTHFQSHFSFSLPILLLLYLYHTYPLEEY